MNPIFPLCVQRWLTHQFHSGVKNHSSDEQVTDTLPVSWKVKLSKIPETEVPPDIDRWFLTGGEQCNTQPIRGKLNMLKNYLLDKWTFYIPPVRDRWFLTEYTHPLRLVVQAQKPTPLQTVLSYFHTDMQEGRFLLQSEHIHASSKSMKGTWKSE